MDRARRRLNLSIRPTLCSPKPTGAASTYTSSATSCTSSNTCGRRPGRSTTKTTPTSRPGSQTRPPRYSGPRDLGRRRDPPQAHPSQAVPLTTRQRRPDRVLPLEQGAPPRLPDCTDPRLADRHRRDRGRAATSSKTAWTSPAPAGGSCNSDLASRLRT